MILVFYLNGPIFVFFYMCCGLQLGGIFFTKLVRHFVIAFIMTSQESQLDIHWVNFACLLGSLYHCMPAYMFCSLCLKTDLQIVKVFNVNSQCTL
jgi:hypothetical protein